jgi:DNA-binding SARP family transcriptional activator
MIAYLRTLGPPALLAADGWPCRLRKKDLALLVYLGVEGSTVHSRGRLASLLWGAEMRGRHSLTQALRRLAPVLPPGSLVLQKEAVRWAGMLTCDAAELLRGGLVATDMDDGFSFYVDHFLQGFDLATGAEAFTVWAEEQRLAVQKAALRLCDSAVADAERKRQWWRVVGLAERAVQIDPLAEHARRQLMHARAALAGHNPAVQYQDFPNWLEPEFGGGPDPIMGTLLGQVPAVPGEPSQPPVQLKRTRTMYLRTLGYPILVGGDGSPVETLRTKDLALLIYLCVEGPPVHSRGHLAALLWGNNTEKDARHSLTQALGRLGPVLPPEMLVLKKETVHWEGGLQCDAITLCGGIDRTEVDDSFSLYGGSFLTGFEAGPGAESFTEWVDRRRPMLRKAAVRVLADAGDSAVVREDWRRATGWAERAVEIDPLWEDGHRRLMKALEASGERNRALRRYEEFKAWLAENVGGEPDPETQALAERLRRRSN